MNFANVVIPPIDAAYTYRIPENLAGSVVVGARVMVPLGNRKAQGFVTQLSNDVSFNSDKIKSVHSLVHADKCFNQEDLNFLEWVANYYGEPLSTVIDVAIPSWQSGKIEKVYFCTELATSSDAPPLRSSNQNKILDRIKLCAGAGIQHSALQKEFPTSLSAAIKNLVSKNLVSIGDTEVRVTPAFNEQTWAKREVALNPTQTHAVAEIQSRMNKETSQAFLLYGVTGSGKTEVYIEAIRYALEQNKGAIVIVPEIALTSQLVQRFYARLGPTIALLHSGLSKRERWEHWRSLLEGSKKVAIGARSAIFAPVKDLGIIIVDEEHDSSYKQQEGLRYNARDIAYVKAKLHQVPLVLGSATPSLETFHRAQTKQIETLILPSKHSEHKRLTFETIDLNLLKPWEMPSVHISPRLHTLIKETIDRNELAFILYNRRGFASYLQCDTCEGVLTCPNCAVTFTYHQKEHSLVCHYCSLRKPVPTFCPNCKPEAGQVPGTLKLRGAGTERTEDEIKNLFPDAKVLRLDRDVANNAASYDEILQKMRRKEYNILVGTQMIAKGHDLSEVTLAAVVDCDVGLHMPDFRAGERVFQLLSQLAGRSGRGEKPGTVILQTRVPKHPSILFTATDNYQGFARYELENRKGLSYPPFGKVLRLVISSNTESLIAPHAQYLANFIRRFADGTKQDISVLGPTACPIEKIKSEYRWHILVKTGQGSLLTKLLTVLKKTVKKDKHIKVIYDLDPQDML